jgi:hypothetical protein
VADEPGSVYSDDPSIPDDEVLYRVISTANVEWSGTIPVRVQTNAFQDKPMSELPALGVPATAVSVFLSSEMDASGRTAADLPWTVEHGVATVTAGQVRTEDQGVVRWPNESGPEHAMVFTLTGTKKSKGQSKRIAATAKVVLAPTPPAITSG